MKINKFVIIIVIIFSFVISGCIKKKDKKEYLDTPQNLNISDNDILTWSKVNNATKYKVIINDEYNGNREYICDDTFLDIF